MLEMFILSPSSTSIEPESLGWGPSICVHKPLGEPDAHSALRSTEIDVVQNISDASLTPHLFVLGVALATSSAQV